MASPRRVLIADPFLGSLVPPRSGLEVAVGMRHAEVLLRREPWEVVITALAAPGWVLLARAEARGDALLVAVARSEAEVAVARALGADVVLDLDNAAGELATWFAAAA